MQLTAVSEQPPLEVNPIAVYLVVVMGATFLVSPEPMNVPLGVQLAPVLIYQLRY